METHLPQTLVSNQFLGIVLVAVAGDTDRDPDRRGPGMAGRPDSSGCPGILWAHYRKHAVAEAWSSFVRPLWLVCGVLAHGVLVSYLRIPVLQRHHYQQVAGVMAVIGFNWLLWRILREVLQERAAQRLSSPDAWARDRS